MEIDWNKGGWFIFGMNLFFITLAMVIVNYNYLDSLIGWEQAKLGIPITLSLFGGAWMMAYSIFGKRTTKERKR